MIYIVVVLLIIIIVMLYLVLGELNTIIDHLGADEKD